MTTPEGRVIHATHRAGATVELYEYGSRAMIGSFPSAAVYVHSQRGAWKSEVERLFPLWRVAEEHARNYGVDAQFILVPIPAEPEEQRPKPKFYQRDRVRLRLNPDIVGTVTSVEWGASPGGYVPRWYYTTSWGSAYPDYELTPVVTKAEARHVLWFFGQDGGEPPGGFTNSLLLAINRADPANLERVRAGFPGYVAAMKEWSPEALKTRLMED